METTDTNQADLLHKATQGIEAKYVRFCKNMHVWGRGGDRNRCPQCKESSFATLPKLHATKQFVRVLWSLTETGLLD